MLGRLLSSTSRPTRGYVCVSCLVNEVCSYSYGAPSFRCVSTAANSKSASAIAPAKPLSHQEAPKPASRSYGTTAARQTKPKPSKKTLKDSNPEPVKPATDKSAFDFVRRVQSGSSAPTDKSAFVRRVQSRSSAPSPVHPYAAHGLNHNDINNNTASRHPRRTPGLPPRTRPNKLLKRAPMKTPLPPFRPAVGVPKTKPQEEEGKRMHSGSLESTNLSLVPISVEGAEVPKLAYGLERALFNPGVYHLQDPRTRVYNFDPYLGSIMPVDEFDFSALNEYITSSRDEGLRNLAVQNSKKYIGSSSSMTAVLSHFHFLLSAWRRPNSAMLSKGFPEVATNFNKISRAPAAVFLRYQDGVYAIDADKEFDTANILMNLGRSMEKLLTMPTEEFERFRKSSSDKVDPNSVAPETYHYTTCGNFLMRAQLDAHDPRLPGTGMFDLKTRAVASIRMHSRQHDRGLGYQIKGRHGQFESFEREYFDMIRTAFLKYSLQVRIGRMDGIFVAYHNVQRIFGFQYVSLPELDLALHGTTDPTLGDTEFQFSVTLWDKILSRATEKFPNQSLRFHFETRETVQPSMYIFAEPVTDEEINEIQNRNKEEIEVFQKKLLYPESFKDSPSPKTADTKTETETTSPHTAEVPSAAEKPGSVNPPKKDLFAIILTVRSSVNGKIIAQPRDLTTTDKWELEYTMSSFKDSNRAWQIYKACQIRREKILKFSADEEVESAYQRQLATLAEKGRAWRMKEDKIERETGTIVLR
ncbi:hypothetical protein AJ79_08494 [Helicocarpus griseus UAMH5409]|uniref:Mitochondrial mRNA processing protein PET127 n=1 Tax=Helicocarpus griseus UAMH5409 TaxID=1447875 RepID=A0A2B7WSW7_9EURO|nr:hypothetical protein AJ79_08494 [Helicocarpus griseus UAMH5409]